MIKYIKSLALTLRGYTAKEKWASERGIKINETDTKAFFTRNDEVIVISRKHEVYYDDIIDYFDYYFTSVKYKTSEGLKIVDYSATGFHVLTKSNVGFFFSSLPESDHSTEIYINKLKLKGGDEVFDLGGYCGATSYFFSKAVGSTGKVISVEADPKNFEVLQKNIAFHKLTNVIALNNFIWHKKDIITFNSEGNMGSTAVKLLGRNDNVVNINSICLEDLLLLSQNKVDAIKMDIEGAELDLIAKSDIFFKNHHPKLMIEPHVLNGKVVTDDVIVSLEKYGYKCELLKQDELHLPLIYAE